MSRTSFLLRSVRFPMISTFSPLSGNRCSEFRDGVLQVGSNAGMPTSHRPTCVLPTLCVSHQQFLVQAYTLSPLRARLSRICSSILFLEACPVGPKGVTPEINMSTRGIVRRVQVKYCTYRISCNGGSRCSGHGQSEEGKHGCLHGEY